MRHLISASSSAVSHSEFVTHVLDIPQMIGKTPVRNGRISVPVAAGLALICGFSSICAAQSAVEMSRGASREVVLPTAGKPAAATSLGLGSNEVLRTFDLVVENTDPKPMAVYGVQSTSGLFVVSFPPVIAGGAKGKVTLIYAAKEGAGGATDLVRLLTDHGEKTIQVAHDREPTVRFDATTLLWQQGEKPSAKSITFTMLSTASVPKGVRALGSGAEAALTSLGNGRYQVSVTPGSTATAETFPVMIEFSPVLPGVATAVYCTITPRG